VKLQDSYRTEQGIGLWWTCWLLTGGLTLGARDRGCLGRSSGRNCVGKSVYRRRQRKAGMGGCLCMGTCILALDPFYNLTSNFSCPYNQLLEWSSC
jgi:hypothetical protein